MPTTISLRKSTAGGFVSPECSCHSFAHSAAVLASARRSLSMWLLAPRAIVVNVTGVADMIIEAARTAAARSAWGMVERTSSRRPLYLTTELLSARPEQQPVRGACRQPRDATRSRGIDDGVAHRGGGCGAVVLQIARRDACDMRRRHRRSADGIRRRVSGVPRRGDARAGGEDIHDTAVVGE